MAGKKKGGMTKKWIAINLLLLAAVILFGWRLRESIHQFNTENSLAKIRPARDIRSKITPEPQPVKTLAPKVVDPAEFAVIPEKNIFSETRSKDDKMENIAPPEPPPLTQKPILVGVVIDGAQKTASIIDPVSPQMPNVRGRTGQIKRIGDVYQGYTITEISPERIVLESGARREVIPLHEGTKRTPAGKTPILSTRVIPIGAGISSGGTPVTVGGGSAPGASIRAPMPSSTAPGATITPGGVIPPPTRQTPTVAPSAPPSTQSPQPTGNQQIIRTPFGDIVRPAR
jgi:hypothetical protein